MGDTDGLHQPSLVIPLALLILLVTILSYRYIPSVETFLAIGGIGKTRTKHLHPTTVRSLGLPNPTPYPNFDLASAKTRNYIYDNKSFRHPYHQTMAHQPMDINTWIEIDSKYKEEIELKQQIIEKHGKDVLDSTPDNEDACRELLELLVDWLPRRYPTIFTSIKQGRGVYNSLTGETVEDIAISALSGVEALKVISRLVQTDFLMAREREDGRVYCTGGLVAFPGSYLLSEKINLPISTIHSPVPRFNEKLLPSVERALKKFKPNEPFERSSWMIVDDDNLFWHNIASIPAGGKVPDTLHPNELWIRLDRQTFLKLPRSNGIAFGVHPIMSKLEEVGAYPLVPKLLEKVVTESGGDLLMYKGVHKLPDGLVPYLREMHEKQIRDGLIRGDEDPRDFRDYRPAGV